MLYNLDLSLNPKKWLAASQFQWAKHVPINWVYKVKICLRRKKGLQRQKLYKQKNAVYNVKIYVNHKKRGLQRQNLCKQKKMGVYNVKIYVNKKNSGFTTSKFT